MAKDEFLDNIDEVTGGADMTSTKKSNFDSNKKLEMKMKNLKIAVEWDKKIKAFTGSPSSGYMVNAIKAQMIKDGIL